MNAHAAGTLSVEALAGRVGEEIGLSAWHAITQERIDAFAEITGDHQFIHVDPPRARAETPFRSTIAHGFLTLSLLSVMASEVLPAIEGQAMGISYGFDKVRLLSPVRAGARVRGRFTLADLFRRSEGEVMLRYAVVVEIEGEAKPALIADWLTIAVVGP